MLFKIILHYEANIVIHRMCLLTLIILGMSGPLAQSSTVRTIGVGNSSCGAWTESRRSRASYLREQWVLGYLSGIAVVNQDGDDPLRGMDADGVWGWIDNYCRANPIRRITDAANAFYQEHPR